MNKFEEILPLMVKIPLFSEFDPENENDRRILSEVYNSFTMKKFKKGELIIQEGDAGDEFYILYSGKVHVHRKTLSGDRISLAILSSEQNIFFGETALIGNDTRSASIDAETDCTTIVWDGEKFHALCEKEPILGYRVLNCLSKRLFNTLRESNRDKAVLYQTLFDEIENGD